MKNIYSLLLIITLIIFGCSSKSKTENKTVNFSGSKYVKTEPVTRGSIESSMEFQGRIEAEQIADLAPSMPLKIEKIYVKAGDLVKKGTILAAMDKNTLIQFESAFKNAEKNYQRAKNLLSGNAIDQRTYDDIEALYISSKAAYETNLDNLQLKAPFDGVVTAVTQKEGELYNAYSASGVGGLIRIMNLSNMKAVISIPDKDLVWIKKGSVVRISSDAVSNKIFTGTVRSILPEANALSGLYKCEISIKNRNNELKHNQFARIKIVRANASNALIIPVSALLDSGIVFTAKDDKAVKNYVKTGIINKTQVQILNGLLVGEQVITEGSLGLGNGSSITVKN